MSPAELLRMRLRCEPNAPRKAREALSRVEELAPVRQSALLVASELTTNAVLHSGSSPDDELELRAERVDTAVRITVTDSGASGGTPRRQDRDPSVSGGMGLRVVEQLAARWGSRRGDSLTVWADLPLARL
jgi:anti-sigma regulatory factor (Ser/Thr protein kinase)